MRSRLIICAAVMGLVLGFAARGEATSYTFTKLEDTSGVFLNFGFVSINDVGAVAFSAFLDTDGNGIMDGSGIFRSDGTTMTTIADNSGPFAFFGTPSINDGGTVAFWASLDAGGSGIFRSDGTTMTTIADNSGPLNAFNSPSINDSGTVAFWASVDGVVTTGIFTGDGTTTTPILDSDGPFSVPNLPSINNGGTVVFTASLDAGGTGIFAGSGGAVSTIVDDSGAFSFFNSPSGNDGGTVAFWARLDTVAFGIFRSDGTTIADTTGGQFFNFTSPSMNAVGRVAFQGFLSGSNGIFTGPDPVADKVIAIGDPLSGSTVETVIFSREGLNDAGQIAFVARLADGSQGVYRADPEDGGDPVPPDPVPIPVPIPDPDLDPVNVTIDIKPGSDRNSVNLGSQGVVRVAILSSSTFDAATVDPTSLNLSGAYELREKGTLKASYKDVNKDGLLDLVVHVQTQSLNLAESTTATAESIPKATLTGMTYDGTIITGSDSIHSVP